MLLFVDAREIESDTLPDDKCAKGAQAPLAAALSASREILITQRKYTMTIVPFINEQTEKFIEGLPERVKSGKPAVPVITIAMQPGSGGLLIAENVAKRLGFRLYNENLLVAMAAESDVNRALLKEIEKGRPSELEDFIASILPRGDYVYKGDYFMMLKKMIEVIGSIGKAVIVGRGGNFIIPQEKRFSIRVVAPLEIRAKNVAYYFKTTLTEAEKRIKNRQAKRRAFIKENFRKDIDDPMYYDLVMNTERMDLETCTEMIIGAIKGAQVNRVFEKNCTYILK